MYNKFKNDTSLTRQGDNYQYLVALEYCLDAEEGDIIYIEQRGDVASEVTSVETKHHSDENHTISDRHIDFWKTLKNLVENKTVIDSYKNLVLLTTSSISATSRLSKWNSFDKNKKLETLKEITFDKVTENIRDFVKIIFKYSSTYGENDLLNILEKFIISSSQPNINEKLKLLANKECFKAIPSKNRKLLILDLLAYVREQGMFFPKDWKIEISDFIYQFQRKANYYTSNTLPIPNLYKKEAINIDAYKDYNFVKEIKAIKLDQFIPAATGDYYRMQKTAIDLADNDPLFSDNLEYYKKDVLKSEMELIKSECIGNINDVNDRNSVIKQCQKCFYESLKMPLKGIEGYDPNQEFFQKGSIHTVINEEDFSWLLEVKKDLNEN